MPPLEEVIREWQQARNDAPDADVASVDAKYALAAGLPVLATGEGLKRAEHAGCRVDVPGVPSIPMTPLLEELT